MRSSSTDAPAGAPEDTPELSLASAAERHGSPCELAANRPLAIGDTDGWWYVAEGTVDLFAVPLAGRESPGGRRTHLMTCGPGEVLFGIDSAATAKLGLLVVGRMNARVLAVPTAALEESTGLRAELAHALDVWIGRMSEAAARMVAPRPTIDLRLEPGETVTGGDRRVAGATSGLVWVPGLAGASFLDVTDTGEAEAPFPLHARAWINPAPGEPLSCTGTEAVLADSSWRAGLARFHAVVLENIGTGIALGSVDEFNLLTGRDQLDTGHMRATLRRAAAVPGQRPADVDLPVVDDPLVKAMTVIARALGSETPSLGPHERTLAPSERLQALASSARLRLREVRLPPGWSGRGGQAYLAWNERNAPCALLPHGRAGYRLLDAAAGEWTAVDEQVATTLQRRAWAVYASLAKPRVSATSLLAFALRSAARDVLALAGFALATAAAGLVAPIAVGRLVDTAIPLSEHRLILELALVLCGAGLVGSAFFFLCANACVRLQSMADSQAQSAVLDRLLRLPSAFFRSMPAATLARRALGVSHIRRVLARGAVVTVLGSFLVASNLAVMAWFSPRLSIVAAGSTGLAAAIIAGLSLLRLRFERRVLEVEGQTTGSAFQFIRAIAKIRIAGAESRVFSLWMGSHAQQRYWMYRTRLADNAVFTLTTAMPALLALFFFALAGTDLPPVPGDFVAFLTAFSGFTIGFSGVARELTLALSAVVHFDRIRPILNTAPETPAQATRIGTLTGRVEVAHVTFHYHRESAPVLRDISIRAEPGQFVAIAGPSGSGKSTLLRLLLGFEQPDSGAIFYDGQELNRIDLGSVRRQFGVVLQEAQLSTGTILDNIVGVEPVGRREAWEAAELAGIADEIRAMPMGMSTLVSQGGVFSGGQRQRLMIARALVRRPKILLLDEATSAVDNKTQFAIARNVEQLNMTRIVIAHRLSSIRGADIIYVLDEHGRLVEQGPYEDLMRRGGLFATLARRQTL